MDQRSNILMLRIVGGLVILGTICALVGELQSLPNFAGFSLLVPIGMLTFGVGIAQILLGIAAVLQQRQRPLGEAPAANVAERQLFDLTMKVEELSLAIVRLTQTRDAPSSLSAQAGSDEQSEGETPAVLIALQRLFEELRDLSLLTDEQRRQRAEQMREARKATAVAGARALVRNRQWADAERAITEIEREWPGDGALAALGEELSRGMIEAETASVSAAESEIETEMSLSHWDQAVSLARALAANYPASARAATLLDRVERENAIYTETTVQRLFDEIRHSSERRAWRRALEHAQTLLAKFPGHPRSEPIRKQFKTIQENAEIEERQEQEARIGELIRARRFREAIDLSEELIRQFPASRQAETVMKLLPRIRELAEEEEKQAAKPSV
jgi:hypothetical protein